MPRSRLSAPRRRRLQLVAILSAGLALLACSAAAPVVSAISSLACGALTAVLGPSGEFWGTACKALAQAIADEIAADTTAPTVAGKSASCTAASLVPVPGFEGVAEVCPGLEAAAARGAAKAMAAGKAAAK